MDRGDLVPDEVLIGIIAERLESGEADHGFILDGFPRTVPQAEALDAKLLKLGRSITAVILIDVDDDEIVHRLSGRRVCQEKRPRLPRRVQPAEDRRRLRHRRLRAVSSATTTSPKWSATGSSSTTRRLRRWSTTTRSRACSTGSTAPTTRTRSSEIDPHPGFDAQPRRRLAEAPSLMIIRKTDDQIGLMAAAGAVHARCMKMVTGEGPARRDHGRARRGRREVHPLAGRRADLQGLPRFPRLDLCFTELDGRPRHPRARTSSRRATSSRLTSE